MSRLHCLYLLGVGLLAGCHSLEMARPVAIRVQDAETGEPLPGAEVTVRYQRDRPTFASPVVRATAGEDGIARLPLIPIESALLLMEVKAAGYMAEDQFLPVKSIEAIPAAHLLEQVEKRPATLKAELFVEPQPSIELIVPDEYRGVLKVQVEADAALPTQPGVRVFAFEVPRSGQLKTKGPALVRHVFPPQYKARLANGTQLTQQPANDALGFWWLQSDGPMQYFFVGTAREHSGQLRRLDQLRPMPRTYEGRARSENGQRDRETNGR